MVCKEHVGEGPILAQMSEPLRLANFAAMRRKANVCRRALVREFVTKSIVDDTNFRVWASIAGFSSFMQLEQDNECVSMVYLRQENKLIIIIIN